MPYDWTKPNETLETIKTNILTSMKVEEDWYAVSIRFIPSCASLKLNATLHKENFYAN